MNIRRPGTPPLAEAVAYGLHHMRRPGEPTAPSRRYVHLDSPGWALWELVVAGFSVSFAMGCATLFYLLQ